METAVWQEYNQEVSVIGIINTSNQNQINSFVAENSITFPILFDSGSPGGVQGGDVYDMYYLPNDGSPYPRDFIIDQNGIIQYANNEIDTAWMLSIIEDLLYSDDLLMGDINFDQSIDILDIVLCVNIVLGSSIPSQDQISVADLNDDNFINVLDIILLVNIILADGF
tara:strand:+ start:425 stop:928 length:504 start_codon:yes stop_codon:yes gene_type:complete